MATPTTAQATSLLDDVCRSGVLTLVVGARTLCTHGDDGHLHPEHPRDEARDEAPEAFAYQRDPMPAIPPVCHLDGRDGRRIQAVVLEVDGRPGPTDEDVRRWAGQVDWTYATSAQADGGVRRIRWATQGGDDCRVGVLRFGVTSAQVQDFERSIQAMTDLGLDRADRKYLAFVGADVGICGIATATLDDSPTNNASDHGVGYARVDEPCWEVADQGGHSVAAHEVTHTLGAVQEGAPNGTEALHCVQEWDLMCYDDGGDEDIVVDCEDDDVSTTSHADRFDRLLDCGGDDYFNAGTPTGWLARHWNVANSGYLFRSDDVPDATVWSPLLGAQGPVLADVRAFDACDLPLQVEVADGAGASEDGVLRILQREPGTSSVGTLRTSASRAVGWVNEQVGRQVLELVAIGIDPDDGRVRSPDPGTIVVHEQPATAQAAPVRVQLRTDADRLVAASIGVSSEHPQVDAWLRRGVAQGLGLGTAGRGLLGTWPEEPADDQVAGALLQFLYQESACGQDRRVTESRTGNDSQLRVGGVRRRVDLGTSATTAIEAALDIASWLRERRGGGWADVAVVCRADLHADCLAGSGLVGDDGLVLYVPGGRDGTLPQAVASELMDSLGSKATIHVLGGPGAVSTTIERQLQALGEHRVVRLAGRSRFATAVAVADQVVARRGGWPDGRPRYLLVRGDDPVDAVVAGAFAARERLPILLTGPDLLAGDTLAWLRDNAGDVIGVGGPRALAPATLTTAGLAARSIPTRVAGPDRFSTATTLASHRMVWDRSTAERDEAVVFVPTGRTDAWALALAASPVAVALDAPVLWVAGDRVPAVVAGSLSDQQVVGDLTEVTTVVVGGPRHLDASTRSAAHAALLPRYAGNLEHGVG